MCDSRPCFYSVFVDKRSLYSQCVIRVRVVYRFLLANAAFMANVWFECVLLIGYCRQALLVGPMCDSRACCLSAFVCKRTIIVIIITIIVIIIIIIIIDLLIRTTSNIV